MATVRVRFAPSPTGFFHIGSARTALFNWLYARHTGGAFVLRIEDTDAARNTEEALRVLLEGMRWLGLDWDEGPEKEGACGPYFQSQRGEIYAEYIERLRAAGRLYEKDGAQWFRLEGERYTVFDAHKQAEVEKVKTQPIVIEDAVRGRVEQVVDQDFVVVRSDGSPVFHLVNVVDDLAMGITHVIRGEDHLPNTGKHIALYEALGAPLPVFAHLPLILKSTGKGKMSKRDEGALIEEYQRQGYLPEAVRNYLALLGWSPKDDAEIFEAGELIERFELSGINSAAARFDEQKMAYVNTEHLRRLPVANLAWLAAPRLVEAGVLAEDADEDDLQRVLALCQEKIRSLETLPEFVGYCFSENFTMEEQVLAKLTKKGDPRERVQTVLPGLEALEDFTAQGIEGAIEQTAQSQGSKLFDYFPAVRFAVSGQGGGPDLLRLLEVLGKERVVARLKRFAENRGVAS